MKKWISILDDQPQLGKGALIAFNTGVISVGYRVKKKNSHDWQVFGDLKFFGLDAKNDFVTHWMELPDPPKGKILDSDLFKYPMKSR